MTPPREPEQEARSEIDELLGLAGWSVQNVADTNLRAARGVAIREFPLKRGHGFADYLLYIDGRAAGVIEAKKRGVTLSGVEIQAERYAAGLPDGLPSWLQPLPFAYQSTGVETRFTSRLDPQPRARNVFAFHRPETMAQWLDAAVANQPASIGGSGVRADGTSFVAPTSFRARLHAMPPLVETGLWPAQITAIHNLEHSLAEVRPRALIQMATGSGKTFTAISAIYRLIKFAGARRVLFLVDRGNLGRQTKKEFDAYASPYVNFKFGEEFIVQHLTSNTLDRTARVAICTIQRMYAMLRGRELSPDDDEASGAGMDSLFKDAPPIDYNPAFPIETFDVIVTDEAHRSIYNLWRQVLEYFDAHLIGLTATPSKQTFGFFNRNLVMEYGQEQAVADRVNVNYDVYRIRTAIGEQGGKVESGYYLDKRDKITRKIRWEQLDEEFAYDPNQLDRDVVAVDQIRTIIRTFRDRLPTEIFPDRTEVPKTLIFAKDDSHAEDIVRIVREEFAKGNEFAQKITYRTTGQKPEDLISAFRNSYNPRIAVTVDMIATGTDIKPLEIVMFMRAVKSRSFFEQMKGRGVRVIKPEDLQAVTPDARAKDHFVIVDCVGVCEQDKTDSRPMDQKKSVPLDKLLQAVALGNTEPEVLSSIAARFARLDKTLPAADLQRITDAAGGLSLCDLARRLVTALDPDATPEQAPPLPSPGAKRFGGRDAEGVSTGGDVCTSARPQDPLAARRADAVIPLHDPALRNLILALKEKNEQTIDTVTQDRILEAGFSEAARERARGIVQSFEAYIAAHRDEITALQILYNRPTKAPLRYEDLKALAEQLQAPPHLWTESQLWYAYAALDASRVKGAGTRRLLTDLVSLVRFALHQDNELVPYPERVATNFKAWLAQAQTAGKSFTEEQRWWLAKMAEHIAANLGLTSEDFDYAPFAQQGGLGKLHQLFGAELPQVIASLNEELVA